MSLLIGARKRTLPLAAVLLLAAFPGARPLAGQDPEGEKAAAGREHVVRRGDTLWDLAKQYLNNPFLWTLIYEANRGRVQNPHLIYPPERIIIPPVVPGQGMDVPAGPPLPPMTGPVEESEPGIERTRFYHGGTEEKQAEGPKEIFLPGEGPLRYQVQPGEFYSAPWISTPGELPVLGELVEIMGRGDPRDPTLNEFVHPFDRIALRYLGTQRPPVGEQLLMVRRGRTIPGKGEIIEPAAIVTVQEHHRDVMIAQVSRQFGELHPSDLAMPLEPYPGIAGILARDVEGGPEGQIIDFQVEQPLYGITDIAFVSLGWMDGLEVGDVVLAYLPEREAGRGYTEIVPSEPVASMLVLRVREHDATVQVTNMVHSTLVPGLPVRLAKKMP